MSHRSDIAARRADFPILRREVNGKPLIYFDSANTSQKPQTVIDAVSNFYAQHNANVARAVHRLSEEATALFEDARATIAGFLNAARAQDVVLTSGTTAAIHLVAQGFLRSRLSAGDEILITWMEHHANIVPWQLLCEQTGAKLVVAPILDDGSLNLDVCIGMIGPRTRLVAATHVSNVLGTINPVADLAKAARAHGVPLLIDGSQAVPHFPVDVQALGCDFYCFTGHKLFGPTGTGVLWGRAELLEAMSPVGGGGEMIEHVSFEKTVYAPPPRRFEAGTPNIAGFIGLAEAIRYVQSMDAQSLRDYEDALGARLLAGLREIAGLRLIGDASERVPVYSFVIDGAHATDLAMLLDHDGVAVRSGQHCAHPLMQRFGVSATLRASLAFYNTPEEITQFLGALERARSMLV